MNRSKINKNLFYIELTNIFTPIELNALGLFKIVIIYILIPIDVNIGVLFLEKRYWCAKTSLIVRKRVAVVGRTV